MGGGLTKTRSLQRFFPNFSHENWVEVPAQQLEGRTRYGDLTTLRNIATKQEIDRYQLTFYSDRQQRIYQECFMQRLREQYLVNSFHYQPIRSSSICSSVRGAVVYIQHIPIRLSDVTDIPFDESLYILKCSLFGFQKLYTQSGYFQVMQQHIGIDKQGHVKVWLNADLSKNYPYIFQEETHQSRDYERIMVGEIIGIVQKNTNFESGQQNDSHMGYIPISSYMQRINTRHPSFHQAKEVLNQYIARYQIQIPKRCSSVVQIFQEQYGEDFNITSASDFLDHIDVGDNQVFNNEDAQTQQKQQVNIASSRSHDRITNFHNQNKASTPSVDHQQNFIQQQASQAPYKEYQPICSYKPNDKNRKISVQHSSNRSSRIQNNQNLKSKSKRNSNNIYINRSNQNSKRNSNPNSIHNSRIGINNGKIHEQSLRQSQGGLYTNRSHNSNLYKQLDEDFNKICSGSYQNENLFQNTSKARQDLSQSSSSRISRHPSIPKITFSYNSQNNNTNQPESKQFPKQYNLVSNQNYHPKNITKNQFQKIKLNNEDKSIDQIIQKQIKQDIEKQLRKSQLKLPNNSSGYFLKSRTIYVNNRIQQCEIQEEIDPEIMKDLLTQFPQTNQVIF